MELIVCVMAGLNKCSSIKTNVSFMSFILLCSSVMCNWGPKSQNGSGIPNHILQLILHAIASAPHSLDSLPTPRSTFNDITTRGCEFVRPCATAIYEEGIHSGVIVECHRVCLVCHECVSVWSDWGVEY